MKNLLAEIAKFHKEKKVLVVFIYTFLSIFLLLLYPILFLKIVSLLIILSVFLWGIHEVMHDDEIIGSLSFFMGIILLLVWINWITKGYLFDWLGLWWKTKILSQF